MKSREKSDAHRLILESSSTLFCGYLKAERVGAIYLPATVIGTAFTTNSARLGLFERPVQLINTDAQEATVLELDSTFCKVYQNAFSDLKEQAIGASRGGKNPKVHVLINERMQLLKVVLICWNVHDSEPTLDLLKGIKLTGKTVPAYKAYSCEQILLLHDASACTGKFQG